MNDAVTAVSRTLRANNELTLTSLRNRLIQLLERKDVLEAEIRDVREGIYACESTLRGLPATPITSPAPAAKSDDAALAGIDEDIEREMNASGEQAA